MLVLTQMCVGAFIALWLLSLGHAGTDLRLAALASLVLAGASLGTSILHLGRPIYAWRAMRGLRRSWLSREVLTLSLFACAAGIFAAAVFFRLPGRGAAGCATAIAGLAGITCSARIYMVRARPAWFSGYTVAEFFATGLLLGPAFVQMFLPHAPAAMATAAANGAAAQLITQFGKFLWLSRAETRELRASALLLGGRLRALFGTRLATLIAAGIAIPLATSWPRLSGGAFAIALAGELLGRHLFFVSVVPKNMAAAFARSRRAA